MILWRDIDGPPPPENGWQVIQRLGALTDKPRVHRLKWRWMMNWWDRRRRSRRRGVRVS